MISLSIKPTWRIVLTGIGNAMAVALFVVLALPLLIMVHVAIYLYYIATVIFVMFALLAWMFWVLLGTPASHYLMVHASLNAIVLIVCGAVAMALFVTWGQRR